MPYIHVSRTPGRTLADYHAVQALVGGHEGKLVSIAGEADAALHVIDVWQSKSQADRFAAEVLFPAFQKLNLAPGSDATYIDFETDDVDFDPLTL
ncbi:hypothetical protein ACFWVC_00245 [Streptomyces sp. NPDC058691]|uniref:hypothetical protein n=1 Tax=Streptomyces sp. NPDC058691 TaxID=3346601 RepID=UPI00365DCA9A